MKSQMVAVPRVSGEVIAQDFAWALMGSFFIALCAQISVDLPFTVVPTSFQAQAVLFAAMLLGPRRGFLAAFAYLAEGAAGLPVFAGLAAGSFHLVGPTAGYLLAYLPVAYVVGFLSEQLPAHRIVQAFILLAGNALVLLGGFGWLALFAGHEAAWTLGVAPFIVTDCLKVVMVACLLPSMKKLVSSEATL